ncbi:hypothetical protein EDB81DRAFT_778975 [Dactylonectria macrodidyma]|uniref:Protein HRI1 n=1 Tax=Dactylonectria macrodidyma TaxID=307937 RepID=A0A9P9JET1_9HYPO|nr:hypothetical protein EDB81DRAFT_778975 [Dactylonectria macrodidyma]
MTVRLSTRISIRWDNDAPSEPTHTVVLSVGSHFMDLRIKKDDNSIDWAFAGTREIVSEVPLHCRWHHVIDSRLSFDSDEGKFEKLPNGDDLETGSMPCAEKNNHITPYEEVWRQIHPTLRADRGWILQADSDGTTIFLGCFGGIFLAMKQDASGVFSVRKEELQDVRGRLQWVMKYESGDGELPSLAATNLIEFVGEEQWKEGDEVVIAGDIYRVKELQTFRNRTSKL